MESPISDLMWLKQEIANREQDKTAINKYFYIQQGNYQGETVFTYSNCCPFCDSVTLVYNCSGVKIEEINFQEITDLKVIWSPEDFVCQL